MKDTHTEEIIALLWFILAFQIPQVENAFSFRNACFVMGFASLAGSFYYSIKGMQQ